MNNKIKIGIRLKSKNIKLSKYVEIGDYNVLENVSMGKYSNTADNTFISNAEIGCFVSIASMVSIGAVDYPVQRALQHRLCYCGEQYGLGKDISILTKHPTRITKIGHDVSIGHGCIIKSGVTIGNGAVIGSGTIITKDVPPYAIVAKSPQQIIRMRFEPECILRLEKLAIWNWTHKQLKKYFWLFQQDINEFLVQAEAAQKIELHALSKKNKHTDKK